MEIRLMNDGSVIISGYVNAVERDSKILSDVSHGKFIERVTAGVFKRAIEKRDKIELQANHNKVIGSTKENLELKEDNIGLYAKATVTDPETVESAKKGELRGWSFGFIPLQDEWQDTENQEIKHRSLLDIDLLEVSILTNCEPAYSATSIETRNEENKIIEIRAEPVELYNVTEEPKHNLKLYEAELEILKLKN